MNLHDRGRSPLKNPASEVELKEMLQNAAFRFCFVRNPYTRALSAYLDKIKRKTRQQNGYLKQLDPANSAGDDLTFEDFLEFVARQSYDAMNEHWRPQHVHIRPDLVDYNAIGCFERFNSDLRKIFETIDAALVSYIEKVDEHSTNANDAVSEYYNPSAVRKVQQIYEDDFLLFGYSDDPASAHNPPTIVRFGS